MPLLAVEAVVSESVILPVAAALALLIAGCVSPAPEAPPPRPSPGPPPAFPPATLDGQPVDPLFAPVCLMAAPPSWPEPCLAHASPNDSPSKTEIDLIVNPLDPFNVVVGSKDLDPQASACVWAVPQATRDGGRTWATVYVGGKQSERQPGDVLHGWRCITDPIFAAGLDGALYYALQAYDSNAFEVPLPGQVPCGTTAGSAFFLAVSRDGGASWPTILPMHVGDGTAVFHDYPRMATSPATGSVFTVWNQYNSNPCALPAGPSSAVATVVSATRDGGQSVDAPAYVPSPENGGTLEMRGFAVAGDGTVYVAMDDADEGEVGIWLSASTDDGRTFGIPAKVNAIQASGCPLANVEFRCGSFYELAVDNSGGAHDGRLHAVWMDATRDTSDILAAWSDDRGMTWSEPVRVNDDDTSHDQLMARIAVGPDGTAHVAFLDRRWDAGNRLLDATYAFSADGGDSWVNQRLTSKSFDGDLGVHQGGFPFIGDYIGIGAAGDHVYVGFPTTATGRAEVAVAHISRTSH